MPRSESPNPLALAYHHYQTGRLEASRQLCCEVLVAHPQSLPALNLLGAIHCQTGEFEAAIAVYQTLLSLDPQCIDAYCNLGVALRRQGKLDQAIVQYRRALVLQPNNAHVYFNLANALQEQGQLEEAKLYYGQAILLKPDYTDAHCNLGSVLLIQGQFSEAISCYQRALALQPDRAVSHYNLGNALKAEGKLEAAVAAYEQAIALNPRYLNARCNLGAVLQLLEQYPAAVEQYQQVLAVNPQLSEVHYNLGNSWRELAQMEAAIAAYRQAIALDPRSAETWHNLGMALSYQGVFEEAIACFDQALALDPCYTKARFSRAVSLLTMGNYAQGWVDYEFRWGKGELPPFTQPLWDGTALEGKTILLYCEQGYGDAIQFIRYVPSVVDRGGRVVVNCREALADLFSGIPGVSQVIAMGNPLPPFDCYALLMSLPHLLGTTLETIPAQIPYLLSPAPKVLLELQPQTQFKVGIVWASGYRQDVQAAQIYRQKTCSLSQFASLLSTPGISFYSLQVGNHAGDLAQLDSAFPLQDLSHQIHNFADTAALIAQLDLVISVDTAVAHLAGALGKPVWVMLPFYADWRWFAQREDSPWYPTMRLFRQQQPGNWREVLDRLTTALQRWVETAVTPEGKRDR